MVCAIYLNARANFIPKWGEWYAGDCVDAQPYIYLQLRAWMTGHLALLPHPAAAGHDYTWGRAGMHTAWGLGVPLLALPFHILGRAFGAPSFPDHVRFLIFYVATAVALARTLHVTSPKQRGDLVASCAAAGFMMVFPTFIGLIVARFLIYDQTIATAALWSVLQLAGVLALLHRSTTLRLVAVCAAAGFAVIMRAPLAAYGFTTLVLAMFIAHRQGLRWRSLAAGAGMAGFVTAFYLFSNFIRFGSPLNAGYSNLISGPYVGRLVRWGLPFAKVPLRVSAKEMYATLFHLDPVPAQTGSPPPGVAPYVTGDRFREYYSPSFDRFVLAGLVACLCVVVWRLVRGRLWRRDADLRRDRAAVIGAWALPPTIVLFVFYAQVGNMVTRYLVDLYPAFAAASLCAGLAAADWIREQRPRLIPSFRVAVAGAFGLYIACWTGWPVGMSHPVDAATLMAKVALIDAHVQDRPPVPRHFKASDPRGPQPVHMHLDFWQSNGYFASGMTFAMPHSHCVTFTFLPGSGSWGPGEEQSLAGFRVNADSDPMTSCGPAVAEGGARRITMCDPRPPPYLLDGMRLYSVASLDENLVPIDRLRLMSIDPFTSCR